MYLIRRISILHPIAMSMKSAASFFLFVLFGCGCGRIETVTQLQTEQKMLKDSANYLNDRIGQYLQKGIYDSAEIQRVQLGAVQERLADIQASLDSRVRKR